MVDYQKMYANLCAAASEAIDALSDTPETGFARKTLQEALTKAEERYLQEADSET